MKSVLLISIIALTGCSSSPPSEDVGGTPVAPPLTENLAPFGFESATDETGKALNDLFLAVESSPASADEGVSVDRQRAAALQVLSEHPEEAAEMLAAELEGRDPSRKQRFLVVFYMLGQFVSDKGADVLYGEATRALPDNAGVEGEESPAASVSLLRLAAADSLGLLALHGSERARQRLLDLVKDAESDVKRVAIRRYYRASTPRWKAKRAMANLLKPEERYLLFAIY